MQSILPFEHLFEITGREPLAAPAFDVGIEYVRPSATRFFAQKQTKRLLLGRKSTQGKNTNNAVGVRGTITHLICCNERIDNMNDKTNVLGG